MRRCLTILLIALSGMGACATPAPAFTNGRAPASALSTAAQGGCVKLAVGPASAWNTFQLSRGKTLPLSGCDSGYRPYAKQVYWRNYWCARGRCGNAAVPGTSNHGFGLAGDVPLWVRREIDRYGARFGWAKKWSDAPHEWWHVKYRAGVWKLRPDPGTNPKLPVLRLGSGGPGQGGWVIRAQHHLQRHKACRISASGNFKSNTRACVQRFQRTHKLAADGAVGPATWKALRAKATTPTPKPKAPLPAKAKQSKAKPKPKAKPIPLKVSGSLNGPDVSVHQGNIDFRAVRRAGFEFAIFKTSEGQDFRDKTATAARVKAIKAAGLVPGTYHFARPRAGRSGAVEARWYVRVSHSIGVRYRRGTIRPVLDLESTALGKSGTCSYAQSFIREIKRLTGRRTVLYTYPGFGNGTIGGCRGLRDDALWLAHYTSGRPTVPAPWATYRVPYRMWQFTSTGKAAGIGGRVDLNVVPNRGDFQALRSR